MCTVSVNFTLLDYVCPSLYVSIFRRRFLGPLFAECQQSEVQLHVIGIGIYGFSVNWSIEYASW